MDFLFVSYPPVPDALFEEAHARVDRQPSMLRKFRAESPLALVERLIEYETVFPIRTIDVFCHSTPHGVRLGGEYLVHDGAVHSGFSVGLRAVLSRNRDRFGDAISTFRLLSCGSLAHGRALARAVDSPFFQPMGTIGQVNAADFGPDGFRSLHLLESLEIDRTAEPEPEIQVAG